MALVGMQWDCAQHTFGLTREIAMQLIRHPNHPSNPRTTVVCLGVFDGLHRGHQALLSTTKEIAKTQNLRSAVLSFEPYPQRYFAKKNQQPLLPRLMRFRDKYTALGNQYFDAFYALCFNDQLASLPGAEFVKRILVKQINASVVVIGDDFRFGHNRDCGVIELQALGASLGFEVIVATEVKADAGVRCSSSRLRAALDAGDFNLVEDILGRPYALSGCVRPGAGRGHTIGVPTANVHIPPDALPLDGVYAVSMITPCETLLQGVANIGTQPTFRGTQKRLEIHVFDFDRMAYGEYWQVRIHQRIRGVKTFAGVDELVGQIQQDRLAAREFFN